MVGLCRPLPLGRRKAQPPQLSLLPAHLQPFFSPHPLHALGIDLLAFPAQQGCHPSVTIARMILAQLNNVSVHLTTFQTRSAVAVITRPGQPKGSTGFCRRANPSFDYQLHRPALGRRAYHFFEFTSFNICTCTVRSATARFNRPFSSANARKRRASFTSMPPYLARHL